MKLGIGFLRIIACFFAALSSIESLRAQVPQLMNYQGRVLVGSVNFDGSGSFKFALVDGSGSTSYWSNDDTSVAGSEPTSSVTIPVAGGLYTILLGNTAIPNMTALSPSVFLNTDVWLRVWFSDGINGFQLLTPDQRVAAVGYAMMAETAQTVPDNSISSAKLAPNAVTSAHLASNAVTTEHLAPAAIDGNALAPGAAAANLAAGGQAGAASGGIILSEDPHASGLIGAGYLNFGRTALDDRWQQLSSGVPPSKREGHTAVWTGSVWIIWGGNNGNSYTDTGAIYNPVVNAWRQVDDDNAPSNRSGHSAVWTGSEMIVWGGRYQSTYLNTGARYDPVTDTWSDLSDTNEPQARANHSVV